MLKTQTWYIAKDGNRIFIERKVGKFFVGVYIFKSFEIEAWDGFGKHISNMDGLRIIGIDDDYYSDLEKRASSLCKAK